MTQPPGSPTAAIKLANRPGRDPGRAAARKRGPERWTWLAAVLVIALPIAALWPVCRHDFTSWDDNSTVRDNPTLNPVTWHSLHVWWTTTKMDLYVPVTYTAWGIIAEFSHIPATVTVPAMLNPIPFHTANLVLHVLCCVVVFQSLRLLLGQAWPAAVGALWFGLHPVQVETVGWVSGLKDLLMALLGLLAIWQYLVAVRKRHEESGRGPGAPGWRRRWQWNYALATACFILGMLAKPNELMVPVLAGILDLLLVGKSWRRAAAMLGPWLALSAAWLVVAKFVQPAPVRQLDVGLIQRPLVAIASIVFYAGKLVWPINLTVDYGWQPSKLVEIAWPILLGDGLGLAAAGVGLWLIRRSARPVVAGAIFFLAALAPVLGFVTFDFQDYSNVADHYLYLPMFGVALMAAWAVSAGAKRNALMTLTASAVVLGLLGAVSYWQTQFWESTWTLFERTTEVNPNSAAAYHSLALYDIDQGELAQSLHRGDEAANFFGEAQILAQQSIALRPSSEMGYVAYGMSLYYQAQELASVGDNADATRLKMEAAAQYLLAYDRNPEYEPTLEDLAGVLTEIGNYPAAEKLQAKVVQRNPNVAQDRFDLGLILEKQNKLSAAITQLELAVQLAPHVPKYHNGLGYAYAISGRIPDALNQYSIALRLDPHNDVAQAGLHYWGGARHR